MPILTSSFSFHLLYEIRLWIYFFWRNTFEKTNTEKKKNEKKNSSLGNNEKKANLTWRVSWISIPSRKCLFYAISLATRLAIDSYIWGDKVWISRKKGDEWQQWQYYYRLYRFAVNLHWRIKDQSQISTPGEATEDVPEECDTNDKIHEMELSPVEHIRAVASARQSLLYLVMHFQLSTPRLVLFILVCI